MRTLLIGILLLANAAHADAPAVTVPEAPYGWRLIRSIDPYRIGDDRDARRMEAWLDTQTDKFIACFATAVDRGYRDGTIMSLLLKPDAKGGIKNVKAKLQTGDRALDDCVIRLLETLHIDPPPQFRDRMRVNLRWAAAPQPPLPPPPPPPPIQQPEPIYTPGVPEDDGF